MNNRTRPFGGSAALGMCAVLACSPAREGAHDAGAERVDAGAEGVDGGPHARDGGTADDAGAAQTDAGGNTGPDDGGVDGGASPDAGTSGVDVCPEGFRSSLPAGQHTGFAVAGQGRSFELLLPDGAGPAPLVFSFHGTHITAADGIADYALQGWRDDGFIVVAPDSAGNGTVWPVWDSLGDGAPAAVNADLALFDALLACVQGHHAVDASRIFVLGQSAGGTMTNFLLGHRADVLAGGIAASGAFDLTQPASPPTSPVFALVTWGGDNDTWSGEAGGIAVENASFAEQAALASAYWEALPGGQAYCSGNDLGHVWLPGMGAFFREVLRAHPKGGASNPTPLPAVPAGLSVSCSHGVATYTPPVRVDCPSSPTAGCASMCQLLGDCVVENGTFGPVLTSLLTTMGFAPTENVCTGCVDSCAADAAADASTETVLACIDTAAASATCGPGFASLADLAALGSCCAASTSSLCARYCGALAASPLATVTAVCGP